MLVACGFHVLRHLLQARCRLWRAARPVFVRLVVRVVKVLAHPVARLFHLRQSRCGSPLFGGHGSRDGLTQFMLHMEEVWRVMRPEVVGHIGEQARCFITGRLHPLAGETRKGWRHPLIPRVLIPCGCRVLQHHVVALGVHPHQAQTARTRFIERHRHLFGRHLVSQARAFFLTVRHHRFFNVTIDLLLRPIRGADTSIEARELQQQTHQAHPTGTHFRPHHVERQHQSMQDGETRHTVKKRHDRWTRIEALLVRPPRLQRATGHFKHLGRLTLGEALGVQVALLRQQVSAFKALPALVTILVALLFLLDYRSHSDLLVPSFALVCVMAKDGEVAFWFQPFVVSTL